MRIGAHVSTSGGIDKAIDRALEIGAECVQLFPSAPQGWGFKYLDEKNVTEFKRKAYENDIGPNVFHGIYLVSLGSDDMDLVKKGKDSLIKYLNAAEELGVEGVIFHLNSHKGRGFDGVFSQVVASIKEVLDNTPENTKLSIPEVTLISHVGILSKH